MQEMNQKRSCAADILRCLALFFVVSVHFFSYSGYYQTPIEGERMLVMTLMRSLFIVCVPLFLTLSGYLLRKKELSRKYYTRAFKIILTYLLASALCMGYAAVFQGEKFTAKDVVLKLLGFSGAPYSWYVEMYLGLFLLIPFLNILWNHIKTQKWKLCLILTFIILTALPPVVNTYDFYTPSWWALPSSSGAYNKLMPAWWVQLYPVTYYFIGCYLREYPVKIKRLLNFTLIVLCTVASGVYTYWRSYKSIFIWGPWCDYHSLFNVILTTLIFVFVINLNYDRVSPGFARLVQKISGLSLGAYLLSWIFDSQLYPILLKKVTFVTYRPGCYFVIVPVVFVSSLALSYLMSKVQRLLEMLWAKIIGTLKK